MPKITIIEDSTPHWTPQKYGYGIDSSRIGKVISQTWWENVCLKDVEMMNDDGPYLWMRFEDGRVIDFALAHSKDKEVIAFLKGLKKGEEKC